MEETLRHRLGSFAASFVALYAIVVALGFLPTRPSVVFEHPPSPLPPVLQEEKHAPPSEAPTERQPAPEVAAEPPASVEIAVPFTSQAPFADWGDPYQEACEEASLIMLHAYLAGTALSPQDADAQILALAAWEAENGYGQDVTLTELAAIAREYYGYEAAILENITREDIIREVALGRPVIVPAAGRDLGNPYFSGEGPWYHMLVITGYDSRMFLTNDPGTRRGYRYRYRQDVLLSAVHDWTGIKEEIRSGSRRALVIRTEPPEKAQEPGERSTP